jgi:hypothetical protein
LFSRSEITRVFVLSAATFLPPRTYLAVDLMPEVAAARQVVRAEAWQTLEDRRSLQQVHGETAIPLTIDALSTAQYVLTAEPGSLEYDERRAGLDLDCTRLVAEWYRKLRPEYFPPARHVFDAPSGDFFSHGLSIRQMTENALRPITDDPEEEARRVNERVENETPLLISKLGGIALGGVAIRTISECTNKAIADLNEDTSTGAKHRGYGGYVPEIEKVMIRDIRLDPETGDRLEEQLGVPGVYINHDVLLETVRRRGGAVGDLSKTELHGTQLLVDDDLMEFVALADSVASEEWCVNVFMGEKVEDDFVKDYAGFRQEALERQAGLADIAGTVSSFVLDLAADQYDPRKAPAKIEEFVKLLLLKEAKKDVTLAEQMFDASTALKLAEVIALEAQGRTREAFNLFEETREAAPGGGYCNGGSCGLKAIDEFTEEGKDLADKLQLEGDETLVRDTERACKCGKKTIVYAYNKETVKKYCENCHAFERKNTK